MKRPDDDYIRKMQQQNRRENDKHLGERLEEVKNALPDNIKRAADLATEKLSKYKDLEIEIERMWGMKATTIPVVIGALGLIRKGLEKYTKQIPGNIKISELQKVARLGTSRILRKTLSIN